MINNIEAFSIIQFLMPMYTAVICALLLLKMYIKNDSLLGRKNIKWIILAYVLSAFCWFSIALYLVYPKVYTLLTPFVLFIFMCVHVLYYRFVFEITRVDDQEQFSPYHCIFPIFIFLLISVWSLFVPFDIQLSLVESKGKWANNYLLYSALFTSKPVFFFVYDVIYALLGLRRTIRFRKVVINYSADEQRMSLVWLYQFLFIMLASFPMVILTLFVSKDFIIYSGLVVLPLLINMFKDIVLVHNVLLENYIIIKSDIAKNSKSQSTEIESESIHQNDIIKLEEYIKRYKPYLNPRLKITDMTLHLNTNRTSLSLLINKNYRMNFSRFINRYRLKELEIIQSDPKYNGVSEADKVAMAGFSDYRGYKRVKQREEIEIL